MRRLGTVALPAVVAATLVAAPPARGRRADPRQPDRAPAVGCRHRRERPAAVADPRPGRPAARRRAARPPDRVVVRHRPPARPAMARRYGFEFVIFRAERGGVPDVVGLAPRDHGRAGRPVPLRPAARGRAAGRPVAAWRRRRADRLRPVADRRRSVAARDVRAAGLGDGRLGRHGPPQRHAGARRGRGGRRRRAGSALELDLRRDEAARAPRPRRLDRLRRRRAARTTTRGRGWRRAARSPSTAGRSRSPATAWFDHQWGDFISIGGGGWDWFAVNLADGTRPDALAGARRGRRATRSSTARSSDADGTTTHLDRDAFTVDVTDALDEPGDRRRLPGRLAHRRSRRRRLHIELMPTVAAQELDTRATTGVVYWEGSQRVTATRDGVPVAGQAYVELTGYASTAP